MAKKLSLCDRYLYIGSVGIPFMSLNSLEDVRNFVESNSFVRGKAFFIGDLSQLTDMAISVLLKFLEETPNKIACYASKDNISEVLMSRFYAVEKNKKYLYNKGNFSAFIASMDGDTAPTPELFLSLCGDQLHKYSLYTSLPKGVRSRVGELI